MKDGLAGTFYFNGTEEKYVAERVAEQLNLLNRDGLHPDVEWVSGPDADDNFALCARTDDEQSARIVGAILKGRGIFYKSSIIAAIPNEEAEPDDKPYYMIVAYLHDIDRDVLESYVDLESGMTALEYEQTLPGIKPPIVN